MAPASVPEIWTALATMVVSTVSRSSVELTAWLTSPSARSSLDRLRELAGAGFDLSFQVGVGVLQPSGHVVELVGERLELVAGLDRDALAQVAAADARGAGLQGLDRPHHLARQEHAGKNGQAERRQQDQAGALDRRVETRIGLVARQLDEHQPAERSNRGIGRQHLAAFKALGDLQRLLRCACDWPRAPPAPGPGPTNWCRAAPG